MGQLLDELLDVLDLEEIDQNIFRGQNEPSRKGRLFGGQVAAQALVAAGRTVGELQPHSLHSYFLRAGDHRMPVLYTVDRIRDGRSFTTRRVVAVQRGRAIFNLSASFHKPESSYEHQHTMPDAPDPEDVPTWHDRLTALEEEVTARGEEMPQFPPRERPIDVRHVHPPTYLGGRQPDSRNGLVWMKVQRELPADPLLHTAILTYASDISLLDNIVRPHGRNGPLGPLMTASLDHALWFHRQCRVDEWLLYAQDSPAAVGARGFARGSFYTRDGVLVASAAQEGLMRPVSTPEDRSE